MQGTHWNRIKCQEHMGIIQKMSSDKQQSTLIHKFGNPLRIPGPPKLYCIDLVEAYVMQESVSLRIFVRRKGMIRDCPMDIHMRNIWRKVKRGKKIGTDSSTRFLQVSSFEKTHDVCQKYEGARMMYYLGVPKV
jgi:hypothetical protein